MTERLRFVAEVQPMFGNIDLDDMDEDEALDVIEETYDIPKDCIVGVTFK